MEDAQAATPIRVVVASPDARFLTLTRFLLPRRGLLVQSTQRPRRAEELVERHRADVLVLDGGRFPDFADHVATRLRASKPSLGIVVVAEREASWSELRSRPVGKWLLHDLASEIHQAYLHAAGRAVPVHGLGHGAAVHT